jgi:endonuclease YncB( thermonuclease family)
MSIRAFIAVLWLCAFLPPGSICSAQQVQDDKNPDGKWEVLDNCQLLTNTIVDGDSFHLSHDGREYVFRLYFVDAPEKDPTLKERIEDQAEYFGIATDDVPKAGVAAARFTREKLTGQKITVTTRWQNAMGRSSLARFYCKLVVNDEDLAEMLVTGGLARIHGIRANVPGNPRSTTFISRLKNLELTAREQKLGIWDRSKFKRVETPDTGTNAPSVLNGVGEPASSDALIELNTATIEGTKMAERIVAGRPFSSVDELQKKVPGIGPKTLEKLRPLVHVKKENP